MTRHQHLNTVWNSYKMLRKSLNQQRSSLRRDLVGKQPIGESSTFSRWEGKDYAK